MHFIIGGGFVSSLSSLRQPDFSPSLFCLRKPQGVYFTETRCVAISDRESQAHKKISIINTPQAILLLMFILLTLLGAGRRWPNPLCWKWSKDLGITPLLLSLLLPENLPHVSLYFYPGQSFPKSPRWKRGNSLYYIMLLMSVTRPSLKFIIMSDSCF